MLPHDREAELGARIKMLKQKIERLQEANNNLVHDRKLNTKLLIEKTDLIERLRAALKPFAEAAKYYTPYAADMEGSQIDMITTLGQLRAAAVAYDQGVGDEQSPRMGNDR
jgi:hypothetical protein